MKYFISGLSTVISIYIIRGILSFLKSKSEKYENGIVRLPRFFLIIGIITTTFFTFISVYVAFLSPYASSAIIFAFFAIISSTLIVARVNCVITFDSTSFTRKTFFWKKAEFYIRSNNGNLRQYERCHIVCWKKQNSYR